MSAVTRLNAQLRGTGDRAMVFAPGFGCDQKVWRFVAPHFESEFVTVLFDHVGAGLSDASAYTAKSYTSLRDYARDLVELGNEVPFEGAVLVGHSCGAMIGLLASIEAPDMFDSLVLISASPRYLDDADYEGGFTRAQIDQLIVALRTNYTAWSQDMAPVLMANPHRPELVQELLRSFLRNDPKIAAEFGATIFMSDWRSELPKANAQCLIVQCAQDPVVPLSVGHFLKSHIANSEFEAFAAEGHFPQLSEPEQLVASIRHFVTSTPAGDARTVPSQGKRPPLDWPVKQGAELRISSVSWSRRGTPPYQMQDRAELEELLLRRAGELAAHFGRYDMYALAIATWLEGVSETRSRHPPVNIRTRGGLIQDLLLRIGLPQGTIAKLEAIHSEILHVLDRHEIAAKNCAVVPAFSRGRALPSNPRDWYEYDQASDEELLFFIDAIERDILSVAALYVRLADLAAGLRHKDD